ncbi:hypothetical protein [Streptosporangium minutum]|uniref:hypothetical protein n=1 Tax=Streptosporangium minutum TaxID=569862 RepID=UPI001F622611|nr:hypothetical protein [Streptosporangium minutum]
MTVHSDELRCEVRHVGGPAHTTNDSIVWIPERALLSAGDLVFNGGTPFVMVGSVQVRSRRSTGSGSRSTSPPRCSRWWSSTEAGR